MANDITEKTALLENKVIEAMTVLVQQCGYSEEDLYSLIEEAMYGAE